MLPFTHIHPTPERNESSALSSLLLAFRCLAALFVVIALLIVNASTSSAQATLTTLTTLYKFSTADIYHPQGAIYRDGTTLYGTALNGGIANSGGIYRYDIPSGNMSLGSLLGQAWGGVTGDGQGNIFYAEMSTLLPGRHFGDLICYNIPTDTYITHGFDSGPSAPGVPLSALLPDGQGNVYGTTRGGPTLYRWNYITDTFTALATFGPNDNPINDLWSDGNGNLYGTTNMGGIAGQGSLFRYNLPANTFSTLFSFLDNGFPNPPGIGRNPHGGVIGDAQGNLYGTLNIGADGFGSLYRYDTKSGQMTAIHTFENTDGAAPQGNLLLDPAGYLYGTTSGGGTNGMGTIFRYSLLSGTLETLFNFDGTNGIGPGGTLFSDSQGNFYGTTTAGGSGGGGTLFRLTVGTVAPEPPSLALAIVALSLLRRSRRSRRS